MEERVNVPQTDNLYQVSSYWKVKSLMYWKERILKEYNVKWYRQVRICIRKKPKTMFVHRLVMISFIGIVDGKKCVNHKDRNKSNNNINNLEWSTHKENALHDISTQSEDVKRKRAIASSNNWKKWSIKVKQYNKSWDLIKVWESAMEIQRQLWYKGSCISHCCRWWSNTSYWFIWKY